jgi:hypothetical protein
MAGGTLDTIVARVESYVGEFLQTRQALLDAREKINAAISRAHGSGVTKIGEATFTLAQLQALAAENETLLTRNADLQAQINSFRDSVAAVQAGATDIMDTLVTNADPDNPWYDTPGLLGGGAAMGVLPGVVVPAAYLVGVGAVLATSVYLFISLVRKHVANVAGDAGSNLLLYGGAALGIYWYGKKQGWFR